MGNLELSEKNLDNSKKHYEKALQISNTKQADEIINMALGNYNQQIGDFKKAMNNFEAINKLNPNEETNPIDPISGSKDFKNLVSTFDKYNSTLLLLNIKEKKPEKNIATKVKIVIQGLGKFIIS